MNHGDLPSEVRVPGGVITVEPHRSPIPFRIRLIATLGDPIILAAMKRDIVVHDESKKRELYRDGPYSGISITSPLNRLVRQIEETGLDEFVRKSQLDEGRIGPVVRTSRLTWFQETIPYVSRLRFWRRE